MSKLIPKEMKDSLQAIDKELSKYDTKFDLMKLLREAITNLEENAYSPTRILVNEPFMVSFLRQNRYLFMSTCMSEYEEYPPRRILGLPVTISHLVTDSLFAMVIDENHCITKDGIEVICTPKEEAKKKIPYEEDIV